MTLTWRQVPCGSWSILERLRKPSLLRILARGASYSGFASEDGCLLAAYLAKMPTDTPLFGWFWGCFWRLLSLWPKLEVSRSFRCCTGVGSKQPGFSNREDTETSVHTKDRRVAWAQVIANWSKERNKKPQGISNIKIKPRSKTLLNK